MECRATHLKSRPEQRPAEESRRLPFPRAAVPAASSAVESALALLNYFISASARPRWQVAGLELAGD
jgi:hypothetical protein